jgi:lysine 2,3-aminomutase
MKNSGRLAPVPGRDAETLSSESPEEPPSKQPLPVQDLLFSSEAQRRYPPARIPLSRRSKAFLHEFFPRAGEAEWSNWNWQVRNSITDLDQVRRIVRLTHGEYRGIARRTSGLPLRITPYYASLLSSTDPDHPIRRSVIPVEDEYLASPGEAQDPLGEEGQSPAPGIVHRYPDRVLFLTTGFCSTYCRYCTRSRMVGDSRGLKTGFSQWQQAMAYIERTPAVRDVLLSGGDPLTLSDGHLEYLLSSLRRIPHVEIIRIGTKVPVVLPYRITSRLLNMLKKFHPIWISIHFTHPDELTPETRAACSLLADAGMPLGSQTVLLKGINDDVDTLKRLYQGLLAVRVRPYYLYQCDPILGSSHFRTAVDKGIEMIEGLRGHTSGYAVPHYVVDAPGGGGKIPLLPDYFMGRDEDGVLLRNYEGDTYRYPEHREGA